MESLLTNATNLLIFGVLLGLLVFVHEFGHFIVAKRLHIPVLEFGFGFPPRVWRFMKRDETEYTLNAIPIGGFVRLMGEEDPSVPGGFASAPPLVRAAVLLAGVTMNFLLAYLVFIFAALASPPYAPVQTTRIAGVVSDSPAALAGLRKGDTIVSVNGQDVKNNYTALSKLLRDSAGQSVVTVVQRGARTESLTMIPRANPPPGQGPVGITLDGMLGLRVGSVQPGSAADRAGVRAGDVMAFIVEPDKNRALRDQNELAQYALTHRGFKIELHVARNNILVEPDPIVAQIPDSLDPKDAALGMSLQTSIVEAPVDALVAMWRIFASIPMLFAQIARGALPENSFVGFIGIYQATGEVAQRGGAIALVEFLGLLSLNLAVVNLLPIPALDGGRLIFVVLEVLRGGKKIDPKKEGLVHLIGFAVLIGLMILISFGDVQRILSGKSIFPSP